MTGKKGLVCFLAIMFVAVIATSSRASVKEQGELMKLLARMAEEGAVPSHSIIDPIVNIVEKNPQGAVSLLLPKIKDQGINEKLLATYVWALGFTRDQSIAGAIIGLYDKSKSEKIRDNCLFSLGLIGGNQAGEFFMRILDSTNEKEIRYEILNLLGQIQYEPALPKTEEILEQDPRTFYWQNMFVFGKMGDQAVPFLISKIKSENINVRSNAVNVLGRWLAPPEAMLPLQEHYWKEKDKNVRGMILSGVERMITDIDLAKKFYGRVSTKEKDAALIKFALESVEILEKMKTEVQSYSGKKKVSAALFQNEYDKLLKSAGKEGDYEKLTISSTAGDEPKLKTLRERILQRDSDESFADYEKVNKIIMMNRLAQKYPARQ